MTELSLDRPTDTLAGGLPAELGAQLEQFRVELTGYCYRMLGSAFEAEDAVQETLIRAWRSIDKFEGRSSLRSWLYRIATNVCLSMLGAPQRRARPMDLGPADSADASKLGPALPENTWLEPIPDDRAVPAGGDPADVAVARESIRLAFVAALQNLPPKQRAVLILREVLHWRAEEVAELLARYVAAFESYDMDALTALLQEDATWSMPPYALWLQTHEDIVTWCLGPGIGCRGSRLIPTMANGSPAFGQYKPAPGGGFEPWSVQVLEIGDDGKLSGITFFLDTQRFFPLFGLPPRLD